ncbi:unnamed protein product [Fraxinus pennsylvanica]|uniref:Uncharacterized protein n=1 Tax=Fraxinus pennsylvanica TaxID=56036 RepID=A0AAD2DMC6_9LAMI|nr:unnamed protein product [Fraxinus pennsylvanica]
MQTGQAVSISPSFNSYSNSKLVEIAARVVEEFNEEESNFDELYEEFYDESEEKYEARSKDVGKNDIDCDGDEDEEFEFAFVTSDSEFSSSISADEIFYNGQIRPVFPILNKDLLIGNSDSSSKAAPIRLPLRKLFMESETTSSSSSGLADIAGVQAETCCTWRPKSSSPPPKDAAEGRCKKRCTFKDLLNISLSDGDQGTSAISTPSKQKENEIIKKCVETPVVGGRKVKAAAAQYGRNGCDRRRLYLPYRKDLVGFFANINRLSRNA